MAGDGAGLHKRAMHLVQIAAGQFALRLRVVQHVHDLVLRAGFNGLYDNDTMIKRGTEGIEVLPELPWHGFEQSQYNNSVFADGNPVQLTIDLLPTSWVFKAGAQHPGLHRLCRLADF